MLTIRAKSGGVGYARRHLEHSDYYDEHRRVQGEWHGRGAELLGLHGEVTREQLEAMREGLHPETGEFLRPRHSADRLAEDGSEQSKGWSLYDLTFSAPKSVSTNADWKSGVALCFQPECATGIAENEGRGGPQEGDSEIQSSWVGIRQRVIASLVQSIALIRFLDLISLY